MFRLIAVETVLFLLPFVAFALILFVRRKAMSVDIFREHAPLVELVIGGLILVIVSLLALATFEQGSPTGTYVPDRFENGRLVPGHLQ